ncbi:MULTISPECIES: hypothetical protein [Streptomycetaceae]|uniref:Uncharacterized protein n=1 Tax=Streptantibioticus cattleyicolor (strain ATCC 35852 / DSM 46488 / JCM 4925 / NBRC 14057 / NRRL 8057) TaxID=1003195 RepID=F8JS25_STREN|nr:MULTISPECIES: hypothetical protein [Streptomycetaceae]AEW92933.1 hypothetical protein SCATT_05620 [Streptantibioticus cattleyicolor NRRL 8057 = DSM 46488]MYS57682.1 hypothetical protein [Streptomyces sp. SID5468]CCB73294.1 protein of unknown function [Streptantibioticus cattleyicolor NRRL 8057 = DSM 46488]
MPTAKDAKPANTSPPDTAPEATITATDVPEPVPATEPPAPKPTPPGRLAPGVYAYTAPYTTVYLDVPLTAHPATGTTPATVFNWAAGAPDDGRWEPTASPPNQQADNVLPGEE